MLLLAIGVACMSGCNDHGASTARATSTVAAAPSRSPSIYPLGVALRDQDGAPIALDVFRGHPVIVTMFYGSCPAACPLLVSHIKELEAGLAPAVRANLRVLLVSFDAERDTPEALGELARAHHVDASRWRFAAAADDDARVLANALGIHYRKGEGGVFSHNTVISILDGEGRIVVTSTDPRAERAPLVSTITRLDRSS
jgi:protein SCO1/2